MAIDLLMDIEKEKWLTQHYYKILDIPYTPCSFKLDVKEEEKDNEKMNRQRHVVKKML